MILCEQEREDNYQEFLRLKNNPNYKDVAFDEQSGGVSAVHIEHCFDKQFGPFGIKRGAYEEIAIRVLRQSGYVAILESEQQDVCKKSCDGKLNGDTFEIKTIEGTGRWAIRTKIYDAAKQGADTLVLLFFNKSLYNSERVLEGWKMYEDARIINNDWPRLSRIIVISASGVIEIVKPPW